MYRVRQSSCRACYGGDISFATFEDCWRQNVAAHVFPGNDQSKMKTGAYKCCFIGMLGIAEDAVPEIQRCIEAYNPNLGTHDIVTCMDFGIYQYECVSLFKVDAKVQVVRDVLRPSLCGKSGVVVQVSSDGIVVEMDTVLQEEVARVTGGSIVEIIQGGDSLHMRQGTAVGDGDMSGFCKVKIDSTVHTIPSTWLRVIVTEPPCSLLWKNTATVFLMPEQVIPAASECTASSMCTGARDMAAKFDEKNEMTAKVFIVKDLTMTQWSQQAQKDAVIDSMCERNMLLPYNFLQGETIRYGDTVHFTWDGCTGTQSVFTGSLASQRFFYVDDSTPAIRAEGRIGCFSPDTGAVLWEIPPLHLVTAIKRVMRRDESLLVVGSSVTYLHDCARTGTVREIFCGCPQHPSECIVQWDMHGVRSTRERVADVERRSFMQSVPIPQSLVVGKIAPIPMHCASDFVLVQFNGQSEIGDRIGEAWFNLKQLNADRLRHRLHCFMSSTFRVGRFTVQERAGISIDELQCTNSTVVVINSKALRSLFAAVSTFCRGASRMHMNNITHGDLNSGNITIGQTTNLEHFSIKMIDLDSMTQHPPGKMDVALYKNDLCDIIQCLLDMVKVVRCARSDHQTAFAKFRSMLFVKKLDTNIMAECVPCTQTADFLSELAKSCG